MFTTAGISFLTRGANDSGADAALDENGNTKKVRRRTADNFNTGFMTISSIMFHR
jgi:hypothetical protein